MNYRHAYHAGNFADVMKHVALARIVTYLQRKEKAFRIYDTHAGTGIYDLNSEQAGRSEEWKGGVGAVLEATKSPKITELLQPWLGRVKAETEGFYPGSPRLVRGLLRKQDRLSVYELHAEDAAALTTLFKGDYQVRVNAIDGWLVPGAHIPPKEARGAMLIDPPFEREGEYDRMIEALQHARRRWPGGTVVLWYPVKKRAHTDEWLGTLKSLGFPDLYSAELYIRAPWSTARLNGSGLVIANAPFTLESELRILLPWLAGVMSAGKGSGWRIEKL